MTAGTALSDATVVLVGGAKNIGYAIAQRAAEAGAHVVIAGRDLDAAAAAAEQLPNAAVVHLDITDEATIAAAAREIGPVDHLVTTAAAHHNVAVTELDHDKVVRAFEAKVIGPLMLAKHFAPQMNSAGSMLLFSGVAAWNPSAGYSVMGITNGAVAFTASQLAKELAPIRVNAISPGIVDSGTYDEMPTADRQAFLDSAAASTTAGRVGTLDDITDAAIWLLSAGFVSGETIHVEGGARFW
jgi:NAD(P)-dependent dehydrogenase (short-subunit alcohol dehydrogenase family)